MQRTRDIRNPLIPAVGATRAYAGAVGVVIATVGLAFVVDRLMPHASLSLLFLTGVLIVATRTGLGPSLLASVLSFLAFNFFFTSPYYTFEVTDEGDVATLVFFLLMAAISGNLAARMHREMAERHLSLQRISNLYEFSRRMSSAAGTEEVLDALADYLAQALNSGVEVLIVNDRGLPESRARAGQAMSAPQPDIEAAWSEEFRGPFALGACHFLKLVTSRQRMAMVVIHTDSMDAEQVRLARSLCDQATIALDRTQLVADLEQARLVSETEQLRSALLSSVSHDLRTPLASIIGSTSSVLEYGDSFSEENRKTLLETVLGEAQRLDRHIQNLLDMTRLGQGSLQLRRDWVDLNDIIASTADRMRDTLDDLSLDIDVAPEMPLLWVHGVLIEQALVNLLDNAIRFSPPGGRILIAARHCNDRVEIDLCDEGPGIPDSEREKIFDMFYTARDGDRGSLQGSGLGLAICRGMIVAHGGSITAHDGRNGRGTCMRIVLPVIRPGEGDTA
ncbi:MAG: DUF4118 domain-containing protein [Thiogranum sp.]|nr:DUF4118 domain-containing protein [Thiogranum sp.]